MPTKIFIGISLTYLFVLANKPVFGQESPFRIKNKAAYSNEQINTVIAAAERAVESIKTCEQEIHTLWNQNGRGKDLWDARIGYWNDNEFLSTWFGEAKEPRQIRLLFKRIRKMSKVGDRKRLHLVFQAPEKTFNCKWSKHAWTIPKGRVSVHCCPQFLYLSSKHQTKAFIHEIGHESGMFFHRKVYWRSAALRTAKERPYKALKNPENYAFFIMEFYN